MICTPKKNRPPDTPETGFEISPPRSQDVLREY